MPKTHNNLWGGVVDFDNLYVAYKQAAKGKRFQSDVLEFNSRLEENLIDIQNKLMWRTWTPSRFSAFNKYEPKWRYIEAPPFKDRVVHHSLVKEIEPLFEQKFIWHSYACRVGRGNHKAVQLVQSFLRSENAKHNKVYALKADIAAYFASVDHQALVRVLQRTIRDKEVLRLCWLIIDACGVDCCGIPVGALTSQLFANVYLNQLDHYVKDQLGVKPYVRYMDDFIILSNSKTQLWDLLYHIDVFLSETLSLRLNPKTDIFPVSQGIDFCGYRIWATHILPRKRNVKRAKNRFDKLAAQYSRGEIDLDDVSPSVMSFLGYMKHCNGYTTTDRMLSRLVLRRWDCPGWSALSING